MTNGSSKLRVIALVVALLVVLAVAFTGDRLSVLQHNVKTDERLLRLESESARKESMEPRLKSIEDKIKEIQEQQNKQGEMLQQILWEQRRR